MGRSRAASEGQVQNEAQTGREAQRLVYEPVVSHDSTGVTEKLPSQWRKMQIYGCESDRRNLVACFVAATRGSEGISGPKWSRRKELGAGHGVVLRVLVGKILRGVPTVSKLDMDCILMSAMGR